VCGAWLVWERVHLVREVAKKVKEEKLFDEVAIAIVKQSPDQDEFKEKSQTN
jgi:hypothetical protein